MGIELDLQDAETDKIGLKVGRRPHDEFLARLYKLKPTFRITFSQNRIKSDLGLGECGM
jgi:hypothetical protein